jgi:hypothetical protein
MLSALIVNLSQNVLSDLDNQTGRNQSNKAFLQKWSQIELCGRCFLFHCIKSHWDIGKGGCG